MPCDGANAQVFEALPFCDELERPLSRASRNQMKRWLRWSPTELPTPSTMPSRIRAGLQVSTMASLTHRRYAERKAYRRPGLSTDYLLLNCLSFDLSAAWILSFRIYHLHPLPLSRVPRHGITTDPPNLTTIQDHASDQLYVTTPPFPAFSNPQASPVNLSLSAWKYN